eukprot:g15257.t1
MADEPPAPEQPRLEDPEVKTLAENLGNLLIGRINLGNIPKELGDKEHGTAMLFGNANDGMEVVQLNRYKTEFRKDQRAEVFVVEFTDGR